MLPSSMCVCVVFHVARHLSPTELAGPNISIWGAFHSEPLLVHLITLLLASQANGSHRYSGSLTSYVSFMGMLMHYLDNNVGGSHAGSVYSREII